MIFYIVWPESPRYRVVIWGNTNIIRGLSYTGRNQSKLLLLPYFLSGYYLFKFKLFKLATRMFITLFVASTFYVDVSATPKNYNN